MRKRVALAAAGIVAAAFVGGAIIAPIAPAGAAAAKNVVLGKSNKATAVTTIQNTKGTPLSLKAKSGSAPLAVSNDTTVKNLSADKLDGLSAGSFARSTGKTGAYGANNGYVVCPKGTIATGGGGYAASGIVQSGPAFGEDGNPIANSWDVFSLNTTEDWTVFILCYAPNGKLPATAGAAKALTAAELKSLTGRTSSHALAR